jgi:hypothetical protein
MIIGGLLTIIVAVVCFIVGFSKGYAMGYFDKENEETSNAHESGRTPNPMEQNSPWFNSPYNPRF